MSPSSKNIHNTITINQLDILQNGWHKPFEIDGKTYKADLTTFALFDYLQYFANLNNKDGYFLKKNENGYIWINYKYIRENNPLLPLSNEIYIKKHLIILEHFGLIVLQRDSFNNVYFKFGSAFGNDNFTQEQKPQAVETKPLIAEQQIKKQKASDLQNKSKDECVKYAEQVYENAKAKNETERGLPRVKKELWLEYIRNKHKLLAKKRKELKFSLIDTHFNELRILQEFNIEPDDRLTMCIENDYLGILFDNERERWRKQGKIFYKEVNFAEAYKKQEKNNDYDMWAGVEVLKL